MSFFGGSGGGGFSFGGGNGNKGSFSFSANTTASNTSTTASSTTTGGLFASSFTPTGTSTATAGFGGGGLFGSKTATQPNLGAPKLQLGTASQSTGGGLFNLSGKTNPNANATQATTSATPAFSFASQSTASAAQPSGFQSGQPSGFQLGGKSLSTPVIASSSGGGFSLGVSPLAVTSKTTPASTAAKAPTLTLGQTTASSSSGGGISFGAKPTALQTSGGLFGSNKTASASAPSKISVSSSMPVINSAATTAAVQSSTSTAPATTTSTTAPSNAFTFTDLENKVNKWTSELEQQEKLFLTQATHVNAWNKVLNENAVQITKLNEEFIKVEGDQKQLNHELDYLKKQQQELDELLKPMEENMRQETSSLSSNIHTHHADLERERTYNMMETIDGQMKGMLQDLREVIDHINASSENTDSNNPINQVGKILSAHMDSLQWLDVNSEELHHKVQELSNHVEALKRDEGKFHLAFNQ